MPQEDIPGPAVPADECETVHADLAIQDVLAVHRDLLGGHVLVRYASASRSGRSIPGWIAIQERAAQELLHGLAQALGGTAPTTRP